MFNISAVERIQISQISFLISPIVGPTLKKVNIKIKIF